MNATSTKVGKISSRRVIFGLQAAVQAQCVPFSVPFGQIDVQNGAENLAHGLACAVCVLPELLIGVIRD